MVTGASSVSVGDWAYLTDSNKVTKIDNNGTAGNKAAGVSAYLGAYLSLSPGATVTRNAGDGVDVSEFSYMIACCGNGPQTYAAFITQNGGAGVNVSASASMFLLNAAIQGNTGDGLYFDHSSGYVMDSLVTGNGTAGSSPATGGIVANYNSSVGIFGSTYTPGGAAYSDIKNNNGPGVEANGNSTVWFCCNVNIDGNNGDGVLLQSNSSGAFLGNSNISGNSPHDLDCTSGAIGVSNKGTPPGIGKNHCSSFTKLP